MLSIHLESIFYTRKVFESISFIWANARKRYHYYCFYLQSHASKMDNTFLPWKHWKELPLLIIVKKDVRKNQIVNFGPLITTVTLAFVTFKAMMLLQILSPVRQQIFAFVGPSFVKVGKIFVCSKTYKKDSSLNVIILVDLL